MRERDFSGFASGAPTSVDRVHATTRAARMGMQDFSLEVCYYGEIQVSMHRHHGFRLSARELARFGLLYLRDGRWNGQQVVPASWVHESVKPLAETHNVFFPGRGYGYMWWSGFGSVWAPTVTLPQGTFFALGFGSQYLFVISGSRPRRRAYS